MKLSRSGLSERFFVLMSSIFIVLMLSACSSGSTTQQETQLPEDPDVDDPIDDEVELTTLSDGTEVATESLLSLGEQIYFDTNLSNPIGQSCASCHSPDSGFDDPNASNPSSIGADSTSFGGRNSPTVSYAAHIPELQTVNRPPAGGAPARPVLIGGLFLDGRALNLEEQAKGPFLNPVEMGNINEADVIQKISSGVYGSEFEQLFGTGIFNNTDLAYNYIADAIAAFERTDVFSPFSSKFDQVENGTANFTQSESRGQQLFTGRAQCDRCHSTDSAIEIFSNFEYQNIGIPANPVLNALIEDPNFVDLGLGAVTGDASDNGKFRNPNLRNIAITAPYMHNGVFDNLTEVIEFYNTRDTSFPSPPEVSQNINQDGNIGELGLSDRDIQDLVAFLGTLTDQ